MKKRKKLKIKPLRGILSLLVLAVVVFAAFVAVKCDGDLSWDNIERTVRGLRAGVGQTDGFEYESSPDALFADLGGGLLRLTGSEITAYSPAGNEMYSEKLRFERPSIHAANGRAAVYGTGETSIRFFDAAGLVYEKKADGEIVSASVSHGGRLAVCADEELWDGAVTVYDIKGVPVYKWYCASGRPAVAAVSKSGEELAVLILKSGGSEIVFIDIGGNTEKARFQVDELVLDIKFMSDGTLAAVTRTGIVMAETNGELAGAVDFAGRSLTGYSLESGEMTVVALTDNMGEQRVMTVGLNGAILGETVTDKKVTAVSACGSKAAVLYETFAEIYKKDMQPSMTLQLDSEANAILMRADGTALIVGGYSAFVMES